MTTAGDYWDFSAKVVFRIIGSRLLLLFLFLESSRSTPSILNDRSNFAFHSVGYNFNRLWNWSDSAAKWAALISAALLTYIGITLISSASTVMQMCVGLALLICLLPMVVFWPILVWGHKLRDP